MPGDQQPNIQWESSFLGSVHATAMPMFYVVFNGALVGQFLWASWPCLGHVLAMSWPRRGHVLAMSWPCRGHVVACSRPCLGHVVASPQK